MSPPRFSYGPEHSAQRQQGIPRPGDMAQVQRPPSMPIAGFQGRPDNQRPVPGPQLAPLLTLPAEQRAPSGGPRSTMQLAPMEPSPSMNEPHRQDSGRAIPVAKLLSGSPTSPKRGSAAPPAFVPAPDSSHRSPPEPFRTTSSGPYPTQQVYQPATTHYLNRAPNNHVLRQPVPRQPPHPALVNAPILPQHSRSPKVETRHEPQYSPAPTSHSSAASYYESTSDASPRTITAPPRHIPRPSKVPPLNYTLSIRQQPVAARA